VPLRWLRLRYGRRLLFRMVATDRTYNRPERDDYLPADSWIATASGRKMFPLDPRAEDIAIEDIAKALSQLCRFTGHCRSFYSVAEHCLRVSHACDPADALWGLLHKRRRRTSPTSHDP